MPPPPTALSREDAADLAGLRAGDERAFARLYARHAVAVRRVARWLLGPDAADSAAQDVWVRVWESASGFRGEAAFGTWLHRVTVTVCLRLRAQQGREAARGAALTAAAQVAAPTAAAELRSELDDAVQRLPPRSRDVWVLHDVLGYRAAEIAAQLGLALPTVRSHVMRSRLALRRVLGEQEASDG